ncbi:hypothetical protein [Streptomyces lavenduligriseus]|uniref:Uncharacterized protein n=1 Tax=Streptomyces lavenduligriseus TaxID=67315 RepID=A0ABT0NTR8_9ACTN|nr:hypothetical protein [Streptomyces lavenduligriseus]MCL3994862.1 hypothetical protein [Streptomyces lavenduligriseus]
MALALLDRFLFSRKAAEALVLTRMHLRDGKLDGRLVAVVGQQDRMNIWPAEQAAAYLRVHAGLMSGEFARVEIAVGAHPSADAERRKNGQKLAVLPQPFHAAVDQDQNFADADGQFWWSTPIKVEKSVGVSYYDHNSRYPVLTSELVSEGAVPLEVGVTKASRTLLHLMHGGGVARWPYGTDTVTLLINLHHKPRARSEGAR